MSAGTGYLTFRRGGGDTLADENNKISETLEFLTQIHKSWDDTEQRAALRTRPRRSVAYEYIGMKSKQSQYLRSLAYSQQNQIIQLPLWHAADKLKNKLWTSQASLQIPVENLWQYRGCSGLILWMNDEFGGTYYPLKEFSSNGLAALNKQATADYEPGRTVICPVAWGVLSQADRYTHMTGEITSINIHMEMMREAQAPMFPLALNEQHDEPEKKLWGRNLPTEHNGFELLLRPPVWASSLNSDFARSANRLDNLTGFFRYDVKSPESTETKEIDYLLKGRNEINNIQRFFCRCKGRLHSFYAPTWLQDAEIISDSPAGSTFILVKYSMYWKYYSQSKRRKKLIVFYKDMSALIVNVAGYTTDDTGEYGKIYLESPLTRAINRKNVLMISYLCRYRLNSDSLTINYETVELATTSIPFAEVTQ